MKTSLFLILALAFCVGCSPIVRQQIGTANPRLNEREGVLLVGINNPKPYTGRYVEYGFGRRPSAAGTYKDGKKEGVWLYFNGKGQIREKGIFVAGQKDGVWETYRENGHLWAKMTYYDGKVRESEIYHANGKIRDRFQYKNGELHGEYATFHENGEPIEAGTYESGKKQGVWLVYRSGGGLERKESYKAEVRDGVWEFYDSKGLLAERQTYQNGIQHGLTEIFFNGKIVEIKRFANGTPEGAWEFYDLTGALVDVAYYKDGKKAAE